MDDVLVAVVQSLAQLRAQLRAEHGEDTFFFMDEYGLDDVKKVLRETGDYTSEFSDKWKCRFRFLDFWGTPIAQNHEKFPQQAFLVPYPNKARPWGNYFLVRVPEYMYSVRNTNTPPVLCAIGLLACTGVCIFGVTQQSFKSMWQGR
jgi:hypothetical protein